MIKKPIYNCIYCKVDIYGNHEDSCMLSTKRNILDLFRYRVVKNTGGNKRNEK